MEKLKINLKEYKDRTKGKIYGVSGIYIILNTANNKYYLGSSKNLRSRWNSHRQLLNKNIHPNPYLQSAWNKHGAEVFEFIVIEATKDTFNRENFYLDEYAPYIREVGYNISKRAGFIPYKKLPPVKNEQSNIRKKKICSEAEKQRLAKMSKWASQFVPRGVEFYNAVLTEKKVTQIREMIDLGFCIEVISKTFKIGDGHVRSIKDGKIWRHLKYVSPFPNLKKGRELISGIRTFEEIYKHFFKSSKTKNWQPKESNLTKTQILNIKNMYFLGFDIPSIIKVLGLKPKLVRSTLENNPWVHIKPDLLELERQS